MRSECMLHENNVDAPQRTNSMSSCFIFMIEMLFIGLQNELTLHPRHSAIIPYHTHPWFRAIRGQFHGFFAVVEQFTQVRLIHSPVTHQQDFSSTACCPPQAHIPTPHTLSATMDGPQILPRLYYFPISGRAEFIKIILEHVRQPYEFISPDLRSSIHEGRLAFDQYPLYVDIDGFELVQSGTIIRYIAKKYGLYPQDPKTAAVAELIVDGVLDFLGVYFRALIYNGDQTSKDTYRKDTLPKWLTFFNRILTKYKRGDGFLFGDAACFADLVLFQSFVVAEESLPGILPKFPIIQSFYGHVFQKLPHISEFIKSTRHLKAMSS